MRKKALAFLLLCFCVRVGYAQNKTTDSLKQLLTTAKEDSGKVLLLRAIARTYVNSKPDSTLIYAQLGLKLSRTIGFKQGELLCLRLTGVVFQNTGNYPKALEIYLQTLKQAEASNNQSEIGSVLSNLADIYFYTGDMKRSTEYSREAISITEKLKDSFKLGVQLANLGDTYEKNNQQDSALYYTRLAYILTVSRNDKDLMASVFGNLGNIFQKLDKPDSALFYYREGLHLIAEYNYSDVLSEIYLGVAKLFLQQQNRDSSLYYARKAYQTAKSGGFADYILQSSTFLTEFYKKEGNTDSAYAFLKIQIAVKDSLYSQQKANLVQSITYDETVRQQQLEEAKEHEDTRLKENALLGGLGALLVFAFLLLRNNRQKRKANVLLEKQKGEINTKALELSEQKEFLQRSYNNIEQLGEIGRKITSSLSVEKVIGTVYDNVNTLMDASVFGIGIHNELFKRIDFPATYEDGEPLPFYSNSIDDKNRFAVISFVEGKEIIIGNLSSEHQRYIQEVPTPHEGKQPVSLIYLPLMVKQKTLGVITVQSFQVNAYSDYHLFMLRNIAIYTAIALDNADSFETLNQTVVRLKTTQSQLIQSEKMASLGELTAGIAHEIQNPLNFVNNFSEVNEELIEEMMQEGSMVEIKGIAGNIRQNNQKILFHGKRADSIVKGMLQHSRKGTGLWELTDINVLCEEYLRLSFHGMRAKEKNFNSDYQVDLDPAMGRIEIMPQDIGRVLLNLCNNAFYAVQEKAGQKINGYKPCVEVLTKKKKDRVQIIVRDNGNGISEKFIEKIFQPFFTTKPTGLGTGLGLSLSYDVIKAHGGDIQVHSTEREGTEFTIELPTKSDSHSLLIHD